MQTLSHTHTHPRTHTIFLEPINLYVFRNLIILGENNITELSNIHSIKWIYYCAVANQVSWTWPVYTGIQLDNSVYEKDNDEDGHQTQAGARAYGSRASLTSSSHTIEILFQFFFLYHAFTHAFNFQWQEHTGSQRGLHSAFCICLTYELIRDHIGRMTRSNNWLFFFLLLIDHNSCRAIARSNLAKMNE